MTTTGTTTTEHRPTTARGGSLTIRPLPSPPLPGDKRSRAYRPAVTASFLRGRRFASADLLLQLVVEAADTGVHPRLARPSAPFAPRHDPDQLVAHHQRTTGVAVAGVLATLGEAGADHAVRLVQRAVGRAALLVR